MGFAFLDHTADLAVRAWGESLDEAFVQAARALSAAMVNVGRVLALEQREYAASASSLELLLVDWLAALVAEKDTSGLVFSRFAVRVVGNGARWSLAATAWGQPLDPVRHEARAEVKGITLLGLRVRDEGAAWGIQYVLDV